MKSGALFLAIMVPPLLFGCRDVHAPNAPNFATAIEGYLANHGQLCLRIGAWPVTVEHDSVMAERLQVLAQHQLVQLESHDNEGQRYHLTLTALPYVTFKSTHTLLTGEIKQWQALCWGQKRLEGILEWEGPRAFGDYQEVNVTYTYALSSLAPWARDPTIQAAFPEIARALSGKRALKEVRLLTLTNRGWVVKSDYEYFW